MDSISLEQNPLLKTTVLARPEELPADKKPTVSLHLLVKNGESCVGRLIDSVGPYINEIVAVVNDTTDSTIAILREKADLYQLKLDIVEVTATTHPELYILDVPETYQTGASLIGEVFDGPFTGRPLLADWAGARNLGWGRCTSEWRLFLDADDVVRDPYAIPGLCLALKEHDIELACTRYQYNFAPNGQSQGDSYRERLARNVPNIEWVGLTHEGLKGQKHSAHIDGNLIVCDMKDSQGAGIRVPGRCFKILYHHARECDWRVSPRVLVYMAMECKLTMPALAKAVIELYLKHSTWPEERAWACAMRGEIYEVAEDFDLASKWYQKSLGEHPGAKSAFRLCRSRFREGKWREAYDAYELGLANKSVMQLLDNGPVYEDASKILVVSCLRKMGRYPEAIKMCKAAIEAFPTNTILKEMMSDMTDLRARHE